MCRGGIQPPLLSSFYEVAPVRGGGGGHVGVLSEGSACLPHGSACFLVPSCMMIQSPATGQL